MKICYVAGPYRAKTEWGVVKNIRQAEEIAMELWSAGFAAICPHKNTKGWGGFIEGDFNVFMAGDLEMLRRCDFVVMAPGWAGSAGACLEKVEADVKGIPVYFSVSEAILNEAPAKADA